MSMNTTTEPLVFDAPTVAVYRATAQATQQWMAARETLMATRQQAEDALLARWGIAEHACLDHDRHLGWSIHGTGERPVGCRPVSINDEDPAWAPDTDTDEGQRLVEQLDALPPLLEAGTAEVVLGLPGRMPFALTRADGSQVRRQALALEGRMYLCWEQEIEVDLDPAVWERVDLVWWRATRREMFLDGLVDRLGRTVGNHVYYRDVDPRIDQLLTLVGEVAQNSRDQGVLTGVQAAMDRAQAPIRELIIRHRIARGFISTRLSPAADTDPQSALEQTITQVQALHAELLASV